MPEERAESVTLWAAFSLSYLHAVQPRVSVCYADAERRDLAFIAFSLSCTAVTIIFWYDSDRSQSKHCNFYTLYVARWDYSLSECMC